MLTSTYSLFWNNFIPRPPPSENLIAGTIFAYHSATRSNVTLDISFVLGNIHGHIHHLLNFHN